MAGGVEAVKRIFERWKAGRRKGLVLTMVAIQSLRERGKDATEKAIREEGARILRETEGRVDWGVSEPEYTPSLVSGLLRELEELGVVEAGDVASGARAYRISRSAEEEFLSRFGHLMQLVRMPK